MSDAPGSPANQEFFDADDEEGRKSPGPGAEEADHPSAASGDEEGRKSPGPGVEEADHPSAASGGGKETETLETQKEYVKTFKALLEEDSYPKGLCSCSEHYPS